MSTKTCATCGKPIPPGLTACPACSADAPTVEGATAQTPLSEQPTIHSQSPASGQAEDVPQAVAAAAVVSATGGWHPTAGQLLSDRYELVREVGRGGMGLVWLANDVDLNLDVAIKLLPPEVTQDPRAQQELKKEAQRSITLSHPNIVKLHTYRAEGDHQYLVMEFVDGPTLDTYLHEAGPLTEARVAELLMDVCAGLAEAHRQNVIHRDIKPHNLLLGKDGRVKISDFGIARAMTDSTVRATGKTVGTPLYMSPEQIRGRACDARSDLYSVGVTAYQLLCGSAPFKTGEIAYQHLNEPPPPIPDTAPKLWPIIEKLLAKDPAARYQDAEELAEALADTGYVRRSHLGARQEADSKAPVFSWMNTSTRASTAASTASPSRTSATTTGADAAPERRSWLPALAALLAIALAGGLVLTAIRSGGSDSEPERREYSEAQETVEPAATPPAAIAPPAPEPTPAISPEVEVVDVAPEPIPMVAATPEPEPLPQEPAAPAATPPPAPAATVVTAQPQAPVTTPEPRLETAQAPTPTDTPTTVPPPPAAPEADAAPKLVAAVAPTVEPVVAVRTTPPVAIPARLANLPGAAPLRVAYEGAPPAAPPGAPAPELQFEIFTRREGTTKLTALNNGDALTSMVDDYLLVARTLSPGYLYVFQLDSHGNKYWLYPTNPHFALSVGSNPLKAGTVVQVPGNAQALYLDENTGVEHVYVVYSAVAWPELEAALAEAVPQPAPQAAPAADAPQPAPITPAAVEPVITSTEVGSSIASAYTPGGRFEVAMVVREPNQLRTRGVGGARKTLASANVVVEFERKPHTVSVKSDPVTAAGAFLVLERWFHHVAPE